MDADIDFEKRIIYVSEWEWANYGGPIKKVNESHVDIDKLQTNKGLRYCNKNNS